MKVKILFLELLAISIAVMMVVSCMTPCIAVGDLNEHQLKLLSGTEKESSKSNYTFGLHGNATLLWSYVNEERDFMVFIVDVLDDINGDGIKDILLSDYNTVLFDYNTVQSDYNTENKLLVISGKDGSTIWSKIYPTRINVDGLDDVNGDGIGDAIISWDDYDPISNQTNITIELLSGGNGEKIWSNEICYGGEYSWPAAHGLHSDLNGDGIEDILVEAGNREQNADILCLLSGKDGLKLWERTFDSSVHGRCYAWNDLTGDGIHDFAVSCYNSDNNVGELFIIRGSDGYVEWNKSFIGDGGYLHTYSDFDGDGLDDIGIGLNVFETGNIENDFKNKTRNLFVLKGTDGSVIWSKAFSYEVRRISHLSDLNGDGIEDLCLKLKNFTTGRVREVQVLSGRDGSLIWKKDVNVSDVDFGGDLNGDGKYDLLFSDSTEIGKNKYLEDVIAISGVDRSEIWKSSFLPVIEIEIPECERLSAWSYLSGWRDVNGDDIPDPSLHVARFCSYWDENASTVRTYDAEKVIRINGKDGSEIWDAEVMADEHVWIDERDWFDFDNDGINDVLLVTGKGVYLLVTT